MKVSDLINELKQLDQGMEVRFEFPSHDYWRSNLVAEVVEVQPMIVQLDGYHDQFSIPKEELDDEDLRDQQLGRERKKVVVLRGYKR